MLNALNLLTAASLFLQEFVAALPALLLRLTPAWVGCCLLTALLLRVLQPRVRALITRFDTAFTKRARAMRYRLPEAPSAHPPAPQTPATPVEAMTERVPLTQFFRFWTNFGSSPSLGALSLLVAVLAFWPQGRVLAAPPRWWFFPGLCFTGGMWLAFVIKRLFNRLRPQREFGAFGHRMNDPSFPSGHSLTAVCFWGGIVVALLATGATFAATATLGIAGLLILLLTGWSRIYLGVHWPSDVGGGYALGVVWSIVCYFALRGVL